MEFFQRAQNPWGQDVLVRISWNLFWLALFAGLVFVVFHLWFRRRQPKANASEAATLELGAAAALPEKIERHSLTSRLFHWVMAVAMLVLLFTGFLPQIGIQFSWLTAHWVAGMILIACILFHIVHATFFQSLRNIWISPRDVREWMQEMRHAVNNNAPPPKKPGKYPVDHKLYHHAVTITGLGVMITGFLMMFRIDTPIVARNPYLYTDATWGWIYVIHGITAVGLVTLTITHIYFAILPEKRWITLSMIFGWISKANFLAHHDSDRWQPEPAPEGKDDAETSEPTGAAPAEAG